MLLFGRIVVGTQKTERFPFFFGRPEAIGKECREISSKLFSTVSRRQASFTCLWFPPTFSTDDREAWATNTVIVQSVLDRWLAKEIIIAAI